MPVPRWIVSVTDATQVSQMSGSGRSVSARIAIFPDLS